MNLPTYQQVIGLIGQINTFTEQSDQKISQLRTNYTGSKESLEKQLQSFLAQAVKERDTGSNATRQKATALKENAEKVYQEVLALDATLAEADKYYVKTRLKKQEELAEITQTSVDSETDVFVALETAKSQYQEISDKYSRETLSALVDGVVYIFSKQRKQDYEELIILTNTMDKLIREIKTTIPELIDDAARTFEKEFKEKSEDIYAKYHLELSKLEQRYETNIEELADDICQQLDNVLPETLLQSLRLANESYATNFCEITTNPVDWNRTVILGSLDYPLELYVSSKILFSLIADKCSPLLVQQKLLRFPMVASLPRGFNLLVKRTENNLNTFQTLMNTVTQSFLSAVPVNQLTLYIIDSQNQGNSLAHFSDLYENLPDLFNGQLLLTNETIEMGLEQLTAHVEDCHRYQLGSEYTTIFDYAHMNPSEQPEIKLLVIFDDPNSLSEKSLSLVNGLLQKGGACGVYSILSASQSNLSNALPSYHEKQCLVVEQVSDMFLYLGLRLITHQELDSKITSDYIHRYLLSFDSLKQRVDMLDNDVYDLLISSQSRLSDISQLLALVNRKNLEQSLGFMQLNQTSTMFPSAIPLGKISAPVDSLFSAEGIVQFKKEMNTSILGLPATFNLGHKNNLYITAPEAIHLQSQQLVHSIMWSFLSFAPVGGINFCIFDGERRGNSITPFLDFRQQMPELFDKQIYTTQEDIVARLQKLNQQMDSFIQDKLGNKFESVVEYNRKNTSRQEPVTLLVIFDFPRNFDSRSMELLTNILINGGRCGIHTVLCHNSNIPMSKYESAENQLDDLKQHFTVLNYSNKTYAVQPYNLGLELTTGTAAQLDSFTQQYYQALEARKRKGLDFTDIMSERLFAQSSAKRLSIPVGIGEGDEIVSLVLGEGSSHHGIIAGATGSGKSTLLHTLIMSGMLNHSPDELHLYLMDFKSGTEFKIYESVHLPHIQLLALDAMQEFGESILENLVEEMLTRGTLFKEAGQTSLSGYASSTGKSLPRILVIMDEFQVLYNDSSNRKIAMNCAELTKRIVTEGRAFGIHLIMATQSTKVIGELTLSHAVIEQMRVRIGLKCGEDDVRYLFSDRTDTQALEMMKGPIGTAVMNLEYMESSNAGFQSAYCNKESQVAYLKQIAERFAEVPAATQTFEGNRTVPLLSYLTENEIISSQGANIQIPMGTLIKVAPPFVMQLDRRRRHNLLICGANEFMTENITNSVMFQALLNTDTQVFCMDGELMIGDSPSRQIYDELSNTDRFHVATNRGDIIAMINTLYDIYIARKEKGELQQTVVVIKHMPYLDTIKKIFKGESVDEGEFNLPEPSTNDDFDFGLSETYDFNSLSLGEKMLRMIDDGSNYGLFFIVSSLEYQSVKENMYYGENVLSKFPERIVYSLSNNDADNLIDGVSVSGLRDNTVYYTDGVKSTFQYKPYIMPSGEDLKVFLDALGL